MMERPGRSHPAKEKIGLVGIGLVGLALAENLIAAGFDVIGCDIDPDRRRYLDELGGKTVEHPADIADKCSRIFLALMTSEIVGNVVEGDTGLLSVSNTPRIIIDTTTGDPTATEVLATRLAEKDVGYLDATVSGSSQQIREKKGVIMVGGETGVLDDCRDLLDAVADKIFHVGPPGSGAKAKLATNLVLGLNRLALAEGIVFAEGLGLDLRSYLELVRETPAYSVAADIKGQKMLDSDFTPQAKVGQHHKDLSLILEEADKAGRYLPMTTLHRAILSDLIAGGDGDLDVCAVIKVLRMK